jgi:hypothetical protein
MKPAEQIRVELLNALIRLGRLRPEWRLGQTLANLAMTAGRMDAGGMWDLEDEETLGAAESLIVDYSQLEPMAAAPIADAGGIEASKLAGK